jgi:hypothetical protein
VGAHLSLGMFGPTPCVGGAGAGAGAGGAAFSSSARSSGFSQKQLLPSHPAQQERVGAEAFGAALTPCMLERREEHSQTRP